jgi:flavin-binding protein dodecin
LTPRAFAPQAGRAPEKSAPFEAASPGTPRREEGEEDAMAESVYKVVELVGTSTESWEKAAAAAVERASKSLRDLRVAEVVEQDLVIEKGKVEAYRTKLKVSFKYEGKD